MRLTAITMAVLGLGLFSSEHINGCYPARPAAASTTQPADLVWRWVMDAGR